MKTRVSLKHLVNDCRVAIFPDIIKIVTIFIKTIFKDSEKVNRITNYVSKCHLYLYFLI